MRAYGILEYSEELTTIIDNKQLVPENSKLEVEIRAGMIVVIDYIYQQLMVLFAEFILMIIFWEKVEKKGLTRILVLLLK